MALALPFDGAITRFHENEAPADVRALIATGDRPILAAPYPYTTAMPRKAYEETLYALQIELAKLQAWVQASGARVVVVFEGRDAAGKGGAIKRFRANLNPRVARVAALPRPSDAEASQWYFQRYVAHLPAAGQIVLFDRSWYNRAVVEPVFGFCTAAQRALFFRQLPGFEHAIVEDGIHLVKLWLTIGRAEQLRRFLERESDPLKRWKLSRIDVEGLARWDAYGQAIGETLNFSHAAQAPWTVILADDKRRARLEAIRTVLAAVPYAGRDNAVACARDPAISDGPDIWNG